MNNITTAVELTALAREVYGRWNIRRTKSKELQ
jgi:hypothetical protein